MRNLTLIFSFVFLSFLTATGQIPEPRVDEKPIVEAVDLSGVAEGRISQDLRDRMQELVGKPFDQLAADEVAFHIQNELSERIAAIRQLPGTQPERIRLIFEFGNVKSGDEDRDNINSRYIIESVEIHGIAESVLSHRFLDAFHALVGEKLHEEKAKAIERRLSRELGPGRIVSRRVAKGADRDHVRLIFEVTRAPLLQFRNLATYILYHSKQNFSFGIEAPIQTHNNRLTFGYVDDGDELLERYEGWRLGFENIKAGTEHVGFRLEYSDYYQKWKPATELALNANSDNRTPAIYRERRTFEPTINLALNTRLKVSLGASVTELQIQYPAIHFQNTNAGTADVVFDNSWADGGGNEHRLSVRYGVRSATHSLDSDFIYTRHLGEIRYVLSARRSQFLANVTMGRISGTAPLFERFSLGNTTTLRGWNKYDVAPLGGDRSAHGSFEYRYSDLQVFYDAGAVWDRGGARETRHAVGFGLHGDEHDGTWFATFAVPVRSGRIQPLKPIIMLGFRF